MDYEIQKYRTSSSKIKANVIYINTFNGKIKEENITLAVNHPKIPCKLITSGKITEG